jgi:hypothetical protein
VEYSTLLKCQQGEFVKNFTSKFQALKKTTRQRVALFIFALGAIKFYDDAESHQGCQPSAGIFSMVQVWRK